MLFPLQILVESLSVPLEFFKASLVEDRGLIRVRYQLEEPVHFLQLPVVFGLQSLHEFLIPFPAVTLEIFGAQLVEVALDGAPDEGVSLLDE